MRVSGFHGFLISLALGASACAANASGEEGGPDPGDLSQEELIAEGELAVSEAALTASDFTNFVGVSAQEVRSDAFVLNDTTDRQGFGVLLPPLGGFSSNSAQLPNVQFYFFPNASGAVALTSDIENAVAPVRSGLTSLTGDVDVALQQNVDLFARINSVDASLGAVNNEVIKLRNDVTTLTQRVNSIPPPQSNSCTANDGRASATGCDFLQCGARCREVGRGDCRVSVNNQTCIANERAFGPPARSCPGLCCLCN
jgi:hypothetical protein